MTLDEVREKIAEARTELQRLQELEWEMTGVWFIRGFGPIGTFAGDPAADEAYRLGKEWRDEVNRLSLQEFDREEAAEVGHTDSTLVTAVCNEHIPSESPPMN